MKASVQIVGGPMDGVEITLLKTTTIGRDKTCAISISLDRFVSKKHALLRLGQVGYLLEDLHSTNGTFIDEEPVSKPILLANGQIFKVGKTLLKISYNS